ncbi:hypothetical protein MTO96_050998 [Rhipicephalus appendiculatus]
MYTSSLSIILPCPSSFQDLAMVKHFHISNNVLMNSLEYGCYVGREELQLNRINVSHCTMHLAIVHNKHNLPAFSYKLCIPLPQPGFRNCLHHLGLGICFIQYWQSFYTIKSSRSLLSR